MRLIDRFRTTSGRPRLISALMRQRIVCGNELIATELASHVLIEEFEAGAVLIRQGDEDDDILFILAGQVDVVVNGRHVARRLAESHVGEVCVLDPSACRTATIVATRSTVTARLEESAFAKSAQQYPQLWREIAIELSHRLDQRAKFHSPPNDTPILFIGSSRETLPVAEAIASHITAEVAQVRLWSQQVFTASHFPIEDLEVNLRLADFAALVAGPDDFVESRGRVQYAPRDNIIFELGLFMGALTRHRTFLITPVGADLKIPSDLLGLTRLRYNYTQDQVDHDMTSVVGELATIIQTHGVK